MQPGVQGRTITLKLKRRKENAPEPPKFMGHGICDNMSRSVTVARFTASQEDVVSEARQMLRALHVDPTQIRGIGLNVGPWSPRSPGHCHSPNLMILPGALPKKGRLCGTLHWGFCQGITSFGKRLSAAIFVQEDVAYCR